MLVVNLMGVLVLALGLVLVAVTVSKNRESYGMNRLLVCRYAAEGVLHEVMFRARREAETNTAGWFDQARTRPDPVLTQYVPSPKRLEPLELASVDSALVKLSILNPVEASALGVVLGPDEYIVEAKATLDKFTSTLHMRMKYGVETVAAGGGESTSGGFAPAQLFSKYVLWTRTGQNTSSSMFTFDSTTDGLVHFEGDALFGNKNARLAMPVTASGTLGYLPPPYVSTEWTQAQKDALFDFNKDGAIGTDSRPAYQNTSEADAKNGSGGGKPTVEQPAVADVESRFLDAAIAQSSNSSLANLWVDAANPRYASGGAMYVGTINNVDVALEHDLVTKITRAKLTVYGSATTKTATVNLPAGAPTVILSRVPISKLGGTYYANLTIASTYEGSDLMVNQYGSYNSLYGLPQMLVKATPAITVVDHLICVDQEGRPKYWIMGGDLATLPTELYVESSEPEALGMEDLIMGAELGGGTSEGGTSGSGTTTTTTSTSTSGSGSSDPWTGDPDPPPGGTGLDGGHLPPKRPGYALIPGTGASRFGVRVAALALQSSDTMLPVPSRLKLNGPTVSDTTGANIDSHAEVWNNTPWRFRRNPAFAPLAPTVLGIYSRGTTLIKAPLYSGTYGGNHLGMWAYYGGAANARIYSDYSKQMLNRAHLGSTISPRSSISSYKVYDSNGTLVYSNGFSKGRFTMYDWDFLQTPPPFWIAPSGTALAESRIVVSFGSIYDAKR
jgi:hypothetical protein